MEPSRYVDRRSPRRATHFSGELQGLDVRQSIGLPGLSQCATWICGVASGLVQHRLNRLDEIFFGSGIFEWRGLNESQLASLEAKVAELKRATEEFNRHVAAASTPSAFEFIDSGESQRAKSALRSEP